MTDYPVFSGRPRDFQEWKKEYLDVIKPRLVGASEAEMSMCLRNCLSQEVKKKLTPDCETENDLLAELDRQYGMKDRVINQILSDVTTLLTPLVENAEKCALFYRGILSAVNDLKDFDSEQCLKNPAVVATLVRKRPSTVRDKWWGLVYPIDGTPVSDANKPNRFIAFIQQQLNIADEMSVTQETLSGSKQSAKKVATNVSQFKQVSTPQETGSNCKVCMSDI